MRRTMLHRLSAEDIREIYDAENPLAEIGRKIVRAVTEEDGETSERWLTYENTNRPRPPKKFQFG